MYCDFFGLGAAPFTNTPDPRFFFNTPDHEEALASLLYAADQRKGFVLVTGEVGSGKTLLSRMLLTQFAPGTKTAVITNTRLRGPELLRAICREFQIEVADTVGAADYSHALEKFLLEQYAKDRVAVLILDEAQNLPIESFEEIRMLGNLEADNAKLLQVLILGQPELQSTFRQPQMRQLFQRIFRTFHLKELSAELTTKYIEHRLRVAGALPGHRIFDVDAIHEIHRFAEGIPRLINQICDNAMLAAYTDSKRHVSAAIIREVVEQMMALTVEPADVKPRGEFARSMMGGPAPERPVSPREEPASAARPDIDRTAADEVLERLDRVDGQVRQLVERLAGSEKKLTAVELRTRTLLEEEPRALVDLDALAAQLESMKTMRSESAALLDDVRALAEQNRGELADLLGRARGEAQRLCEHASASLTQTQSQTGEIQAQTRQLFDEVRRQSEAQRLTLNELINRNRAEFEAARRQVEDLHALLRARTDECTRRGGEVQTYVDAQTRSVQEQLGALQERIEERGERLMRSMEEFIRDARSRIEGSNRQFSELVAMTQTEAQNARSALTDGRKRAAEEAETARARAEDLLRQTQELLVRTREQSAALVSEACLQATEQTRRADTMANVANTQATQTLNTLRTQLAEARLQADRARDELEAVVRGATDTLAETRAAFTGDIKSRHTEIARLREEAVTLRTDLARDLEQTREQLREAIDEHRQQSQFLRRRSGEVVLEAETALKNARTQAHLAAETVRAEIAGAVASTADRVEEVRARADAEIAALNERTTSALAAAEQSAEQIGTRLRSTMSALTGQATELQNQLQYNGAKMRDEVASLTQTSRASVDDVQRRIDCLTRLTATSMKDFEDRIETVRTRLNQELSGGDGRVQELMATLSAEAHRFSRQAAEGLSALRDKIHEETAARVVQIQTQVEEASRRCEGLAADLRDIHQQIGGEIDEARAALQAQRDDARSATEKLAAELNGLIGRAARSGEEVQFRVNDVLRLADQRIEQVSSTADALTARLGKSLDTLQEKAVECQTQFDLETTRVERLLTEITERNRRIIESSQSQVETMARQATTTADELSRRLTELRDAAQADVGKYGTRLREQLTEAAAACERIRADAEAAAADFSRRTTESGRQTDILVNRAEQAVNTLREQSKASLAEVRGGLTQMVERSELIQRDIARLSEDVRESARSSIEQLRESATGAISQIDALRDGAKRDADAHLRRLAAMKQQVEEGAEQIRASAGKLLDQVQSGAATIRQHADELMTRAERGAESVGEQATRLMLSAQTAAERFREQSESLLKRAESAADTIRGEVQALRNDLSDESERVREEVADARKEAGAAREESAEALERAVESQRDAERRAGEIIRRAEEVQDRSKQLLTMPRELVNEAQRTAGSLSEMSRKVSAVVAQLSKAQALAQQHRAAIENANTSADEKLTQLARHTARVGQLVGIIRQLYGTMDARVERMRERLNQAETLCQSVPREIDNLRDVLTSESIAARKGRSARIREAIEDASDFDASNPAATPEISPYPLVGDNGGTGIAVNNAVLDSTSTATATAPPPVATNPVTHRPSTRTAPASLGELVQRNQKLNEWLRQTLSENELASAKPKTGK